MKKVADYEILEQIKISKNSSVYRGIKDGDNQSVIIKTINNSSAATIYNIARFKHEYNIIKNLDINGVIKSIDFIEYDDGFAIILEDFNGITLKERIENRLFSTKEFLIVAIKLAEAVGELHKNSIIHKDIKPQNIIHNSSGEVKLADFGISDTLNTDGDTLLDLEVLEGTLSYMSPEQTGRMNRGVDYRSDMYSLGVVYYEMLTGVLPFDFGAPMEIIHAHIAKIPKSPVEIDNNIPLVVSNIIMKLLSKMAEDRYQNSSGLIFDLKQCLYQLEQKENIEHFNIGERDIPLKFQIPELIVGRESESNELFEFIQGNRTNFMLVKGRAGIGKSTLINELYSKVISREGYYITGKFDQFSGEAPYSAFTKAFQGFIHHILAEGEERLCYWNRKLLHALGSLGKVITDVIPLVSLVIGEQKSIPELGGEEALNRFNYAFKKFISAIATVDRPLFIFIDDLQWADHASLKLLETIITDVELKNLYIIGSYRSTEIENTHMLSQSIRRIKTLNGRIDEIHLESLSIDDVNTILSTFMRLDNSETKELSAIVHNKTGGNPFFIHLFIKTLYEKGILTFNPERGWSWSESEIINLPLTDNVIDMLILKIKELSDELQVLLKLCSCVGNNFSLMLIYQISSFSIDEIHSYFSELIKERLIIGSGDSYRFQHDNIQAAAYNLLDSNEKESTHYKLVSYYMNIKQNSSDNVIFLADQINECLTFIKLSKDRTPYVDVVLSAGIKAKKSSAYSSALIYFELGIFLLDSSSWSYNYGLSLKLFTEAARCSYLTADFVKFRHFADTVLKYSNNLFDKMDVFELEIQVLMAENRPLDAVSMGIKYLKSLGVSFPSKPNLLHVIKALLLTKSKLHNKSIEELKSIPKMEDQKLLAAMRIIDSVATSAYYSSQNVLVLLICKIILLSLKYGNPPNIPFFYSSYGYCLIYTGDVTGGYKYGQLAMELLDNQGDRKLESRGIFLMNLFIKHNMEHIRDTLEPLKECSDISFQTGDIEFACHSLQLYLFHSLHAGVELKSIIKDAERYSKLTDQLNQKIPYHSIALYWEYISILMGNSSYSKDQIMGYYNEEATAPYLIEAGDMNNYINLHNTKLILNYLYGDYSAGLDNAQVVKKHLIAGKSTLHEGLYYFYSSLLLLVAKGSSKYSHRVLWQIKKNQKILKKMSKNAPMNYQHKFFLVEAEIARVKGKVERAIDYYNLAIEGAERNQYLQDVAIIHELTAKFWLSQNRDNYGIDHLNRAKQAYHKWGAFSVEECFNKRYREFIGKSVIKQSDTSDIVEHPTMSTSEAFIYRSLDIATIVKTTQHLSSEIELESLLKEIMKLTIESAGARRGALMIFNETDKKLYIEARGDIDSDKFEILSTPVSEYHNLPLSVINFAQRTREPVIIHDALNDTRFLTDAYIEKYRSKSILCKPIISKAVVKGYLYLENDLVTGTFTPERVEILKILSTQAAISIENAALYKKAVIDGLTQVYNRAFFDNYFIKTYSEAERYHKKMSLMLLDIDLFKNINDSYGHLAGDLVLKKISSRICSFIRKSDMLARYGGEEFVIVLPETGLKDAQKIAEKIRDGIETLEVVYNEDGKTFSINVTTSIGVTEILESDTRISVINRADKNLYLAKERGRNRVV